jgi:hypothetical protein
MIRIIHSQDRVVEVEATGTITHGDYERVLPAFERVIDQHGAIDCLIHVHHVDSIEPKAIMDDLKFDVRHASDFGRVALVTSTKWHEWATKAWAAFIPDCEVKCFEPEQMSEARDWVRAGEASSV